MSILALGRDACQELFASYGVDIRPAPAEPAEGSCGILAFVGDEVRGSLVLAASADVLERSYPIDGEPGPDWTGELTNQLLGRLKNRLLAHGVEIAVSTPVVLRGLRVAPVAGTPEPATESFRSESGSVRIWLDVETTPGFALRERSEPGGMAEGDAILF